METRVKSVRIADESEFGVEVIVYERKKNLKMDVSFQRQCSRAMVLRTV
jgi:hypothetical protein